MKGIIRHSTSNSRNRSCIIFLTDSTQSINLQLLIDGMDLKRVRDKTGNEWARPQLLVFKLLHKVQPEEHSSWVPAVVNLYF